MSLVVIVAYVLFILTLLDVVEVHVVCSYLTKRDYVRTSGVSHFSSALRSSVMRRIHTVNLCKQAGWHHLSFVEGNC